MISTDRRHLKRMASQLTTMRIGAVSYLNSKPLIEGLAERLPDNHLVLDYPSRLADHLAQGRFDAALIPSVEYLRGHDYVILSDACVAARGPVLSVKLYTRVPFGEIRTLALDEGSRTSAMLAQVMLFERCGVLPQRVPFLMSQSTGDVKADAVLMIGDRAMFEPEETFHDVWDLGEEWFEWTGLPFVFAMWVGRASVMGHDDEVLSDLLSQVRDDGVSKIEEISVRESVALKLGTEHVKTYLGQHLHYRLGSAELHGLELYSELVRNLEAYRDDHSYSPSHRFSVAEVR